MTPLVLYQAALKRGEIEADPAQEELLLQLEKLFKTWSQSCKWWARFCKPKSAPLGVYLWGDVGRGKTFLMDLIFEAAPFKEKGRFHFYRFMQLIHQALQQQQGNKNPLPKIAKAWAKHYRLLCLDELQVTDITDAMLLATLFQALFQNGVILVTTSNTRVTELYKNGLQREKFLPAIALLKTYCLILALNGEKDYRLRYLLQGGVYHCPLDALAEKALVTHFLQLSRQAPLQSTTVTIQDRPLLARAVAPQLIWFDFSILCESARSVEDYIEIAHDFSTVILSGVKVMGEEQEASARRFISLVDEFYDRRIKLILSAAAAPAGLYQGKTFQDLFKRTISRLTEMQSLTYLQQPRL